MIEEGFSYFIGWNLIVFSQFIVFCGLYYLKYVEVDENSDFYPAIRYLVLILAIMKVCFFVRIFHDYGFLV